MAAGRMVGGGLDGRCGLCVFRLVTTKKVLFSTVSCTSKLTRVSFRTTNLNGLIVFVQFDCVSGVETLNEYRWFRAGTKNGLLMLTSLLAATSISRFLSSICSGKSKSMKKKHLADFAASHTT